MKNYRAYFSYGKPFNIYIYEHVAEVEILKRNKETIAKGATLGIIAGAAAGIAGAYLASDNKSDFKKVLKKAEKTAGKTIKQISSNIQSMR